MFVTQIAASAERSTKSYRLFAGASGSSPSKLRPPNCPVTVMFWPIYREGNSTIARIDGAGGGEAGSTALAAMTVIWPGRGHAPSGSM